MDKTSAEAEGLQDHIAAMLAALSRGSIYYAAPSVRKPAARGRCPFYPLQAHTHAELIFFAKTRLEFFVQDRWRTYLGREVWALLPGVWHSERSLSRQRYRLLWTSISNDAVGLHVTAYEPGRGYHVPGGRFAFRPDVQDALWRALKDASSAPQKRVRFQGLLIEALCQAAEALARPGSRAASYQREIIERVRRHIDENFSRPLCVAELAQSVHYSPCHLNALFRSLIGRPMHRYLLELRLNRARTLLLSAKLSVKEVAAAVGFGDPLYFSRAYRRAFGAPPSESRRPPAGY